ncbi:MULTISPECIES: SLBB domain-containing protein [Vibrio harveyi group]|uniref:Polysialic acid transport protein KpsD n=1 Tax=Vibrio parahaemolyticus TaxID=670 RepID=A0A7M1W4U9_VIBPH|nr:MULTISPECIES: SLBB domain-containing protein [Vibrio harveyi group]MCR9542083.1 SLBB domain-containing protein [Vibrio alginolyticus]QOS21968.1 polysialic acid transport protein KpsD [Vibrio parahaemolyticus]ULF69084.1 SLBB domain-containing protein [Vibrio alginolyticus]HCM0912771.1 SLBB domain-containing protein [Vibrio parahaemolyticus]HDU8571761.1 SLBB domain-containing protein [Vibrio parahaemolyticus]
MFKGYFSIAAFILASTFASYSMAQTPTPEQIKMFQNLPADQQQALASKYGFSIPSSSSSNKSPYENPQVIKPRAESSGAVSSNIEEQWLKKGEQEELKRFGLDLFAGSPSTFAPISDVPVPANYTVGAGDEIIVQLFGKENETHRLRVNRAGTINFPSLGPVNVAGMHFSDVRDSLTQRVKEQMIGVRSDISLGELRTMQVFVMGDAYKPGAYTVSALTTISQAIYYSGGFGESGALRDIQLKRDGKIIRKLDMYDLLLKGDAINDVRLLPDDVVLIGSVNDTVSIEGEINRPAIYEVKQGETYQQLIQMAGGFTANAHTEQLEIKRYALHGVREALTLDFNKTQDRQSKVKNGDAIKILKKSEELTRYIQIEGDVRHPGYVEWRNGLRVADLFKSVDSAFNSTADVNYAVVVREVNPQRDIEVFQFSLANAILSPSSQDNIQLQSRDRILVFNRFNNEDLDTLATRESVSKAKTLEQAQQQAEFDQQKEQKLMSSSVAVSHSENGTLNNQNTTEQAKPAKIIFRGKEITEEDFENLKLNTRRTLLAPVLLQLQQQSRLGLAPQIAEVFGEVKHPGRYPITPRMTVSTLIEAAGGLTYNAFTINAELARTAINSADERAYIDVERIDLRKAIQGRASDDVVIVGRDRLNILEKPNVKLQSTVTLQGEVRFPGTYTVRQGETLSELLDRAGGLTEFAHPQGAIFTREALRLQEQKLLNQYAADMRKETAKKTFRADSNIGSVISDPEKTLAFVEEASRSKALGRMVVQLNRILKGERSADFMLEDGDFLFVPTFRNTVSIMGEVQVPITYLLDHKLDVDDYLNKAGGAKKQADEDRIFVVRADGSVYKPRSGYWFGNNHEELKAGDTIVVPIDTDYRDALSTWTAATQILYQTGVAINALK